MNNPMPDILDQCVTRIIYEIDPLEIKAWLLAQGLTVSQAYFTYMGAKIIAIARMNEASHRTDITPQFHTRKV